LGITSSVGAKEKSLANEKKVRQTLLTSDNHL